MAQKLQGSLQEDLSNFHCCRWY